MVASHDRQHWFRIETEFDGQVMTARLKPETGCIYFAYFEPYSWEQHLDMLGAAAASPLVGRRNAASAALSVAYEF